MERENGDDYIRRIASFIRTNEQRLAQGTISRRHATKPVGSMSVLAWMGIGTAEETRKPLVFTEDPHHLFYLLMRFESVGIDVGSLDVRVQNPTRPTSISHFTMMKHKDKSDVLSISSLRSSMSSVSMFSLGGGWLGRSQPTSLDAELKYLYSAFTKVPALRVRASGHKVISELAKDPPTDSAIPMDAFKNLQALECFDIDPRILMGWDRLSENLKSLTVKRSGIEDVSELLVDSVVDDKARRDGSPVRVARPRLVHRPPSVRSRQPSIHAAQLPLSIPEVNEEVFGTSSDESQSPSTHLLPSYSWSFLKHLSLSDNSLTFLPSLPPLPSLSSLDISANLLISIPPALSALPALRSLNLANNMIDSVLGIYSQIPSIVALNLSANRLESLCGLERLDHLTRVDIRDNRVDDIDEVGRLADLHDIKEIWLSGNPCTHREQDWRVNCFDLFAKEGREVALDGSTPGIMERRAMKYSADGPTDPHGANGRPLSTANSPTVVAVGAKASPASLHVDSSGPQTFQSPGAEELTAGIATSGLLSSPRSETLPSIAPKARRRKMKRIVDLDDTDGIDESGHEQPRKGHGRHSSDAGILRLPPERRERLSRPQINELPLPQASDTSQPTLPVKGTSSLSRTTGTPIRRMTIDPPLTPSSSRLDSPATVSLAKGAVAARTLSPTKASKRRARVTASVYEPAGMNVESGRDDKSSTSDADFFRKQIEALRNEVGDSWLKVLSQSQLANSGKSAIHREG